MTTDHSLLRKADLQTIFCFTLGLPKWLFMGTFLDWAVFHVRNGGIESWVTNCQSFHKLTCKPVAFAFPRPCYVVMFTPWPQTGSHCASCCSHQSPHTSAFIFTIRQGQRCIWHTDDCSRDDHTILYSSIQYKTYLVAFLQIEYCSIKGSFSRFTLFQTHMLLFIHI